VLEGNAQSTCENKPLQATVALYKDKLRSMHTKDVPHTQGHTHAHGHAGQYTGARTFRVW